MTASWWTSVCYPHVPEADELVLEYLSNPDVMIFNVIYDVNQPYSCEAWGGHGNIDVPLMVDDGVSISQSGDPNTLESLFFNGWEMPKHVFIDHEFNVYYKQTGKMENSDVKQKIDEMLDLMGEN